MSVTCRQMRLRMILAATISSLLTTIPALADKGGTPNGHASDQAQGSSAVSATSHQSEQTTGDEVLLSGVVPSATATTSMLLFTNAGTQSGTATVTLFDGLTGAELAAWTSAGIAPRASLVVDAASIAAKAIPTLTTAQAAAALTLSVRSTLHGTVQLLQLTNGVLSNVSPCGPGVQTIVGGVPGPGSVGGAGMVKLTNTRAATASTKLSLYEAATGNLLGAWTSPNLPAHGSLMISATALAAASNPVVAATTAAFTIAAEGGGVAVEVLSMPKAGGAATVLNNACTLKGSGVAKTHNAADADEHSEDDEDDSRN